MARRKTLPEQIANRLRRDILRGKLPPGSSIKERDNAQDLGVSRTPMREAVRILAKEGLVILRPARSPIVAQPGSKEIADQVTVLIALEELSAELACKNATESQIDGIAAITAHMAEHFDTADPLDNFEVDMAFHTAIAEASNNRALADTHQTYLARLWRARFVAASRRRNRGRVVEQHGNIVAALKARDAEATRAAIDTHLARLAEDVRAVIEDEQPKGRKTGEVK